MTVAEETLYWAWIVAIGAGVNWAFGNRSVFGRSLVLRSGTGWRLARWIGLATFALAATALDLGARIEFLPLAALVGSLVLAFGTARKRGKNLAPAGNRQGTEPR